MKQSVLILFSAIFILSCDSDDTSFEMSSIESILIAKDNLYGNGDEGIIEQNMVISESTTWTNLIAQMNSVNTVSDSFSETDIDFSEYRVIAVFDEIKGNGGHSLDLNIMSNSENIIVHITDVAPEGNATTVITQPYHIVKILNSDLPVQFQ